jgi:hypothetical protein
LNIFSYVVDHDEGKEPNPYFGTCTLCRCKFSEKAEKSQGKEGPKNIVELAAEKILIGEEVWVIGTGGKGKRSVGRNGTLIYAMRVDEVLTREEFCKQYPKKKSEPPKNDFEKHEQFALISRHFWYFGSKAISIPERFKCEKPHGFKLEKKGPHFRNHFEQADIDTFLEWLEKQPKPTEPYEPCGQVVDKSKGRKPCKSSC